MPPSQRRIHITTLASSAAKDINRLGRGGIKAMLALAEQGVAGRYRITANVGLIYTEHDGDGVRVDDQARARELQHLLADDEVAAIVTVRGGAWFTRILDRVNFDVLKRRRTPLFVFGFSEMTTLVAIAALYPRAIGVYDLGPGFLFGGAQRYALTHAAELAADLELPPEQYPGFAAGWALARYPHEFARFFQDVADIVDGKGSQRTPRGRLLAGRLSPAQEITITGGTLSVLLPLLASPHHAAVETRGKWLALEDVNEDLDPVDRMLAGLKMAGLLERAEGFLLGDFHTADKNLSEAVPRLLRHHLPPRSRQPIIFLDTFGHIYPIAPLPLQRHVTLKRRGAGRAGARVEIEIPWSDWAQ